MERRSHAGRARKDRGQGWGPARTRPGPVAEQSRAMSRPAPTDHDLVVRLRAGDSAAFDLVDARYRAALLRHADRHLGPARHGIAEELVQETFLRAHRTIASSTRPLVLRPWLYTVLRNLIVDEVRRPVTTASADIEADLTGGRAAGPHEVVERRDELRALVADVVALPDRQREALVGTAVNGLDHVTVAASLGTSVGGSKSLVNRARVTLARSHGRIAAAA